MADSGSILGGRYRVGQVLGKGGMAVVVEATHLQLGTSVAIKILRDDYAKQADLVERFLREARAAAQLRGDHVCRVQDFGTSDDGIPFMVMERLHGRDLSSILKRTGPIAPEQLASFIVQACLGIAEAHALRMVHRDIKPANLFLVSRPDGRASIKILDFGIAKSAGALDFSLTATTNVMGSPAYMSPEQLKSSKNVDPRSDIWSLGVTMYELVSGQQPFGGETLTELALCISNDAPRPLPETVPPAFAEIILRCLEKDPARRYDDVGALATALTPFAKADAELATAIQRVLSSPPPPAPAQDAVATMPSVPHTETTLGSATGAVDAEKSAPRWRLAIGFVVAAAGLAIALFVMRPRATGTGDGATAPPTLAPATAPRSAPPSTPVAPDAGIEVTAVDAGSVDAVAAETVPPPDEPKPRPTKPRPKKPRTGDDLGSSRY